jgi:glycine cleavage system H lipoate-binding protein
MKGDKMVFVFVALTVLVFLAVDLLLRREDRKIKELDKSKSTPIFLSPDKALRKVGEEMNRLFHLSHTWVMPSDDGYVYVGFDNFISSIFTGEVNIENLPLVGSFIPQGANAWNVQIGDRFVSQLSPISGEVVDINPACKMGIPLESDRLEKSWILKLKADQLKQETHNLMKYDQANMVNTALTDEFFLYAQRGHYLNDGGQFDSAIIKDMSSGDWLDLIQRFFPYQND